MPNYIEDTALVLRRVEYGDADVILDLLCQSHGRVGVFARGARKSRRRFTGGLGAFTRFSVRFRPSRASSLGTLVQAEGIEFFEGLVHDPLRLAAGAWLISLVEASTQPTLGADPFFSYIVRILRWLNEAQHPASLACGMLRAEIVLLQDAGVLAAMDVCQRTGRPIDAMDAAIFCPGAGLVARDAAQRADQGVLLHAESLRLLAMVLDRRVKDPLAGGALHPIREGLIQSWAQILDRPPRTWKTWDQAIRAAIV